MPTSPVKKAALSKVFIITDKGNQIRMLTSELAQRNFNCSTAPYSERTIKLLIEHSPDAVILDIERMPVSSEVWELTQRIKQEMHIPTIALVPREVLDNSNYDFNIDDFVVRPWEVSEVVARTKRILRRANNMGNGDIIKHGALVIDTAKCQVSLSGRVITLTFKEYQLLKFLASNPGRAFSRENLLNKVWGWDYYGGDRTVDVHIRRLRSKIEDNNHSFTETVRSIGYKFKEM